MLQTILFSLTIMVDSMVHSVIGVYKVVLIQIKRQCYLEFVNHLHTHFFGYRIYN
jgi:hypothetical protein